MSGEFLEVDSQVKKYFKKFNKNKQTTFLKSYRKWAEIDNVQINFISIAIQLFTLK